MNRTVFIDGKRVNLAPAMLVGQGGEAEVYDLGDGRVVKWWKPADHPDFAGNAAAQAAAAQRLADGAARLRAIPAKLPAAVVAPIGLALDRKKDVIGYVMPKITGEPLYNLGEPRWRRANPNVDVPTILLALHDAIAGLHRAGIVIGDCNDLNVLVDRHNARVHLIDVDSYQLPGFPCSMFSERFVDPRLCDPSQLVPVQPHDQASDWFAFAAMALRSLLFVGPWGGVARGLTATARVLRRISVLSPQVTYPRTARPSNDLPPALIALFRSIFERDDRGMFPRRALESLRTPCLGTVSALSTVRTRSVGEVESVAVRISDGALWRRRELAGIESWERIGAVIAGQTRFWVGARLGVGFYRAAGYSVGFVFRPDRGPLDDRVAMPRLTGQLVDACAKVGDGQATLWLTLAQAGRLVTHEIVIDAQARLLAHQIVDAPPEEIP